MTVLAFEEELLRALISLDGLSVGGSELVRDARKKLVQEIQAVLSKLDPVKSHIQALKEADEKNTATVTESAPATPTEPTPVQEDSSEPMDIVEPASSTTDDGKGVDLEPVETLEKKEEEAVDESTTIAPSSQQDPAPVTDEDIEAVLAATTSSSVPTLKSMCRSKIQGVLELLSKNNISFDDILSGRATVNLVSV
jgi:hypothetical protein